MSRDGVIKVFVGALIAVAAAALLVGPAVIVTLAVDPFVYRGHEIVGVHMDAGGWAALGILVAAVLVLAAGAALATVAWIGALVETAQRPSKTMFVVLLVTGVLGVGLAGMIIYLIIEPPFSASPPAIHAAQHEAHRPSAPAA